MTKTQKVLTSVLIIVILLGLYIFLDRRSKATETPVLNNSNNQVSTTTAGTGVEVSGTGDYTIEQVLAEKTQIPRPDLSRPVTFSSSVSLTPEAKAVITKDIKTLQADLKKDPANFNAWIQLGILQKMAGDFEGTLLSWKYASAISTTNYVSFGNLGNLYAYFLSDPTTAETYYKKALVNGPTQSYLYVQFAEMYRDIEKNNTKALAVVEQGLAKIPNDPGLLQFKATLQK